jgi:sulfate/thiosulfate-binding protein
MLYLKKSYWSQLLAGSIFMALAAHTQAADVDLLHVSYDPTREFYQEFNEKFAEHWQASSGDRVRVRMSHGGSGRQALSVMQGLRADILSLALAYDIDMVAERTGLLAPDWQNQFPLSSSPYTSTIVFIVRAGNPKNIQDWDDLIKENISIITPNPKTSGGARWNYLAAWGYAYTQTLGGLNQLPEADEDSIHAANAEAQAFVQRLYANVALMDTGARGASNSFAERGMGDVLIAWENEALLTINNLGDKDFEIIVPSLSILAEPPVSILTGNTERRGTSDVAKAYVDYLYTPEGQALAARHFFRPQHPEYADSADMQRFAALELFRMEQIFDSWLDVQEKHFSNGGLFDQITRR